MVSFLRHVTLTPVFDITLKSPKSRRHQGFYFVKRLAIGDLYPPVRYRGFRHAGAASPRPPSALAALAAFALHTARGRAGRADRNAIHGMSLAGVCRKRKVRHAHPLDGNCPAYRTPTLPHPQTPARPFRKLFLLRIIPHLRFKETHSSVNTAFDLLHPSVCFPHDLIKFRYGEIRCRTSYELQFIQLVYMKPCCYLVLIVWKQHHSRNIFVPILCCNEAFYFVIHCKSSIISLSEHTCFSPAASVPISLRKSYPLGTTGV